MSAALRRREHRSRVEKRERGADASPVRARLGIATAVALALAVADLVVDGAVRADPAYAHHRTQGWMGLSFGVLLLVLLSTRLPSRLLALGAGVFAGGLLGNLGSAALHDFLIPNPFVAGDVAFNLADVSVVAGVALVGVAGMRLAVHYRHLLPTHTIPVRVVRYVAARCAAARNG